jgi:hypothetical protein
MTARISPGLKPHKPLTARSVTFYKDTVRLHLHL